MRLAVVPSLTTKGSEVISAYNNILALRETLNTNNGMTLLFNNDRIADLLKKRKLGGLSVPDDDPSYLEKINRFIAEQASLLTATRRFGGHGVQNFGQLIHNLIPYPRI